MYFTEDDRIVVLQCFLWFLWLFFMVKLFEESEYLFEAVHVFDIYQIYNPIEVEAKTASTSDLVHLNIVERDINNEFGTYFHPSILEPIQVSIFVDLGSSAFFEIERQWTIQSSQ